MFVCSLRCKRSRSGFQPYPCHHGRVCRRCCLRTLFRLALLCALLGRNWNWRLDAYRWNLVRRRSGLSANMANQSPGLDFSKMCQRRDITSSPRSLSCACLCAVCATYDVRFTECSQNPQLFSRRNRHVDPGLDHSTTILMHGCRERNRRSLRCRDAERRVAVYARGSRDCGKHLLFEISRA